MRDVTESDERALGIHAWICDTCKHECQTLDDYGEPNPLKLANTPAPLPKRGGRGINKHPELWGVIRRCRRFEARIPGGCSGKWIYVGLFATIALAVAARDAALARRRAG